MTRLYMPRKPARKSQQKEPELSLYLFPQSSKNLYIYPIWNMRWGLK